MGDCMVLCLFLMGMIAFEERENLNVRKAGCSIPVVRVHGVDVDRVRFPAARPVTTLGWM